DRGRLFLLGRCRGLPGLLLRRLLVQLLLALCNLLPQGLARLGVLLSVHWRPAVGLLETRERHREGYRSAGRVDAEHHQAAGRLQVLHELGRHLHLGRAAGRVAERVVELDALELRLVDLLVLLRLLPQLLGVDRGAHAGRDQHSERHHQTEVLFGLAFHLPHRCRDEHLAGNAIEALMDDLADVDNFLLLLAVLAGDTLHRPFADFRPRGLRSGWRRGSWTGGALLRGCLLWGAPAGQASGRNRQRQSYGASTADAPHNRGLRRATTHRLPALSLPGAPGHLA